MRYSWTVRRLVGVIALLAPGFLPAQVKLPQVFSAAPNAAALGKYGDVPVSPYTGTANISIPLYTIQYRDVNIPLSLDYHTGGIRVQERAGWTGLGWVLSGGGVISRDVRDKEDFQSSHISPSLETRDDMHAFYSMSLGNPNFARYMWTVGPTPKGFDFSGVLPELDAYDKESDLFTYNFLGRSGKFLIREDADEVIFEKVEKLIVTPPTSNSGYFSIRDEQGVVYLFNKIEMAKGDDASIDWFAQSWYLTEIQYPSGSIVQFGYLPTQMPSSIFWSTTDYFGSHPPNSTQVQRQTNHQNTWFLANITFDGGYIEFTHDALREDYNGDRITGFKAFSVPATGATPKLIKEMSFVYSHFGNEFGTKRLRLDEVIEKKGTEQLPGYKFLYHSDPDDNIDLNSQSQDFWGYYNGATQAGWLPKFIGGPITIQIAGDWGVSPVTYSSISLPGTDKEPNEEKMRLFSLKEVIYPTGGKTAIETEVNRYNYFNTTLSDPYVHYVPATRLVTASTRGTTQGIFDFLDQPLDNDAKLTIGYVCTSPDARCPVTITEGQVWVEIGNERRDLRGLFSTCHSEYTEQGVPRTDPCQCVFTLAKGQSNIPYKVYIDPALTTSQFMMVTLNVEYLRRTVTVDATSELVQKPAGGLRVKRIVDYDVNGGFAKAKRYVYDEDAVVNNRPVRSSFGALLRPITFFRHTILAGGLIYLQRSSSTVFPLAASVAYTKVVEYSESAQTQKINGHTQYEYYNRPDSLYSYNYINCHTNDIYYPVMMDFETPETTPYLSQVGAAKVDNPDKSGMNYSSKVGYYPQPAGTSQGLVLSLSAAFNMELQDTLYMHFFIRTSNAGKASVKVGNAPFELIEQTISANSWTQLTVMVRAATAGSTFSRIEVKMATTDGQAANFFVDDFQLFSLEGSPGPLGGPEPNEDMTPDVLPGDARPYGLPIFSHKLNGSLLRKTEYNQSGKKVRETINNYATVLSKRYFGFRVEASSSSWSDILLLYVYPTLRSEKVQLRKTYVRDYPGIDNDTYDQTEINYTYGSNHEQPVAVETTNSKGETQIQKTIYAQDISAQSTPLYGIRNLQTNNVHAPVEQYSILNNKIIGGTLTTYKETMPYPDKVYTLDMASALDQATFTPINLTATPDPDDRYIEKVNFKEYDEKRNIQVVAKAKDTPISYIWGYKDKLYPIAEIKNSESTQVAYTSFESEKSEGGWTFTGTLSTTTAKTGLSSYALTSSTQITKVISMAGTYNLEYFAKGPVTTTIPGVTITDLPALPADAEGWILYRKTFTLTGAATISLSATSVQIDELRLHPAGAQMTTYTYLPMVGYNTITDANMNPTYYEYDSFNRLMLIRDANRNILKTFYYNLKNQH